MPIASALGPAHGAVQAQVNNTSYGALSEGDALNPDTTGGDNSAFGTFSILTS